MLLKVNYYVADFNSSLQSFKAVTAYLKSKQLLPFSVAPEISHLISCIDLNNNAALKYKTLVSKDFSIGYDIYLQ